MSSTVQTEMCIRDRLQGALGMFLIMLGIVMLLVPTLIIPVWPWTLTALTARALGAWMCGLGMAAGHCALEGDLRRGRGVFISTMIFCVLQLIALARYSSQFAWGSTAASLYLGTLLLIGILGLLGLVLRTSSEVHR